jgi:broad specificity phosphatase PhoE
VFLVRHGRTELNVAGRLRGRLDPPLDEVGQVQVIALAEALAHVRAGRVVSSPLRRAVQTAQPVAARVGIVHEIDPRLVDRDYGDFAGLAVSDVVARWGSLDAAPGVESSADVVDRARAALDELGRQPDAGPVVLVAHDAVNRLLLASLDPGIGPAAAIQQDCGCWNILVSGGPGWRVAAINQSAARAPAIRLHD